MRWNRRSLDLNRVTTWDVIQEAAALWESLSQNHPFIDGNKRVAVSVCGAFLQMNGYRLQFDDLQAYGFLIELYETGRMRFDSLDAWLRSHVVGLRRPN